MRTRRGVGRQVGRSGDEPGSAGARPSVLELVLVRCPRDFSPSERTPAAAARRYRRDVQQQFRLQRAVGRRGSGGAGAGGHLDHLSLGRLRPLQQRLEEVRTWDRGAGTPGCSRGWVGWPLGVQGFLGGHLGRERRRWWFSNFSRGGKENQLVSSGPTSQTVDCVDLGWAQDFEY